MDTANQMGTKTWCRHVWMPNINATDTKLFCQFGCCWWVSEPSLSPFFSCFQTYYEYISISYGICYQFDFGSWTRAAATPVCVCVCVTMHQFRCGLSHPIRFSWARRPFPLFFLFLCFILGQQSEKKSEYGLVPWCFDELSSCCS